MSIFSHITLEKIVVNYSLLSLLYVNLETLPGKELSLTMQLKSTDFVKISILNEIFYHLTVYTRVCS